MLRLVDLITNQKGKSKENVARNVYGILQGIPIDASFWKLRIESIDCGCS